METNLPLDSELPNEHLALNSEIRDFLRETAKWTFFISILGFIFIGLFILIGIGIGFSSSFLPDTGGFMPYSMGVIGIFYAVLGLISLIPILYLFRFSTNMKTALRNNSEASLTASFSNLKSHYKFYGIFMIIMLVIYALSFFAAIIMGLAI